jgi:hypothetical protein
MTIHVLNAKTLAVSTYTSVLLDVVAHAGEVYFLTATALTKLDATEDLDVPAYVETGKLKVTPSNSMANVHDVTLSLAASAPMRLTATVDASGTERELAYPIPQRVSAQERGRLVHLGRGPRGDAWSFKVATTAAGGNWSLASMDLMLDTIKRSR